MPPRAAGLPQAALAARLAWPRDTLIPGEHSRRTLTVERLVALAQALNVTPVSLLVADPELATVLSLLTADPALVGQVQFSWRC